MNFSVGSLVQARGREWVVLPDSRPDFLLLRPLGGTDDEISGVCTALEAVAPARFSLPDPATAGDHYSCRMLRDALRLGFRSSAGPFRCFSRIAVDPRPYQLVPLLMALRMDPIRLLIADDVGTGKSCEAGLVARELIDRAEVGRLAVLCPPHLAEQWETELREKFHIAAEPVLPGTAGRLERGCRPGESIFDRYPYVIVSLDFIKSDRHRADFIRACPPLVIVDEAHTCAFGAEGGRGRHQRHELVSRLSQDPERHLILVTATPHSGNENAFRSLLALLKPEFNDFPEDLSGQANRKYRERLAVHFVQRRRGDILQYLGARTEFPDREEKELHYELDPEYRGLFEKTLDLARETVEKEHGSVFQQRIHWWSALALLRSVGSSPAAAASTFRSRAGFSETDTAEAADTLGRQTVMDDLEEENLDGLDISPGSLLPEDDHPDSRRRRRLLDLAREADKLSGDKDNKLQIAIVAVRELLREGFHPIIFCRFIPTAEYLADQLRKSIPNLEVTAVTGLLSHEDREERVRSLAEHPKRVLVCTDCLSEGINLQEHFDAVMHYDLAWNPTRHEQREGRVDRFGQRSPKIRVVHYYGTDNRIDGIVLDVLINKHKRIRKNLGISVPVPVDTEALVEAIFEGLLLRSEKPGGAQKYLPGFEAFFKPRKDKLFTDWDNAANREQQTRTLFAQHAIDLTEVSRELESARESTGAGADVARFTRDALLTVGAMVTGEDPLSIDLSTAPRALRDMLQVRTVSGPEKSGALPGLFGYLGIPVKFAARFDMPAGEGVHYLTRTHPLVENLSAFLLDQALDGGKETPARRCGVIRTRQVSRRTTILLLRLRFHILTVTDRRKVPLLVEDARLTAFRGSSENPEWLGSSEAESLLQVKPDGNVTLGEAEYFLQQVNDRIPALMPRLEEGVHHRATEILDAHNRVRRSARSRGTAESIEPHLPPDVLGVYIFLPMAE